MNAYNVSEEKIELTEFTNDVCIYIYRVYFYFSFFSNWHIDTQNMLGYFQSSIILVCRHRLPIAKEK